ncbi:MAG: DUF4093 domain-containing protein [Ruminococcus sp.]|nr:DUF4093 domain-containing protein [Ruminococcus sp.]
MEKLRIPQAVIVEGKYDKIKLSALLDAVIITTDGFRIFKDKENAELIRRYAAAAGIVILTDSDAAGFKIRSHIKGICPEGRIINIYIPDIYGKEQRKAEPSKEGKLGVEGMDIELLHELFTKAGVLCEREETSDKLTMTDLYELGLFGCTGSSELRRRAALSLSLPERMTAKALLDAANTLFDKKEFIARINAVREETEN